MFERLKRLFQRRGVNPDPFDAFQPPQPAPPVQTPSDTTRFSRNSGNTELLQKSPPPPEGAVTLSLRSIVLKLPDPLKGKVRHPPSGGVRIHLAIQQILPQLAQGSVKISFGEIRKNAPTGIFSDAADRDHTLVDLPLQEILSQLRPDQLPRRTSQKKIDIPEEVVPIFGPQSKQQHLVRLARPGKTEAAAAPPTSPPQSSKADVAIPGSTRRPPQADQPSRREEHHTTHKPRPISPSVPLPPPISSKQASAAAPSTPIKPAVPLPLPSALQSAAATSSAHSTTPTPPTPKLAPRTPLQSAARTTEPSTPTAPISTAGSPVKDDFLSVPVGSVTPGWPDSIRQALAGLNTPDAVLLLPTAETEQALKRGKVIFPWKRLKSLVRPPLKTALSPALDEIQLELPLSAIAPLFLAQCKPAVPQRKVSLVEDIPDLFTNRNLAPQAESPNAASDTASTPAPAFQPVAPAEPAPAAVSKAQPTETPVSRPAPTAVVATPAATSAATPADSQVPQDVGELFGQPGRKNWGPAELVQRTASLPGVAGALIIMHDGLLVAADLPPGLSGDGIAAFLPQMHSRVSQYAKELKLGESDNITVVINHVPLSIFRVGNVFFAAIGRAREPLPASHLEIVASHLAPQSK
jgi:predicted regulator of Ras-like GTPase activity (Roadblock/LC7/MglB family)